MRRREKNTHARRTRPQTGTLQQGLDGEEVPDMMLPPSPSATDGCLQFFRYGSIVRGILRDSPGDAHPVAARRPAIVADSPRRIGPAGGRCSASRSETTSFRRCSPAVPGSPPLRPRSRPCHRGTAGRCSRSKESNSPPTFVPVPFSHRLSLFLGPAGGLIQGRSTVPAAVHFISEGRKLCVQGPFGLR